MNVPKGFERHYDSNVYWLKFLKTLYGNGAVRCPGRRRRRQDDEGAAWTCRVRRGFTVRRWPPPTPIGSTVRVRGRRHGGRPEPSWRHCTKGLADCNPSGVNVLNTFLLGRGDASTARYVYMRRSCLVHESRRR
jgi:hypothetical protein